MRNYEILRLIHEIVTDKSETKGPFTNHYLNNVLAIKKLIENERPEMKELATLDTLTGRSTVWETDRDSWNQ